VVPDRAADKGALHVALNQLAEQDPLINLRQDDVRQEISVSLYGEVQKEVIQTTLTNDYHLNITFHETTTICIERPTGTGTAIEIIYKEPNPFLATIGFRIEPAPADSGIEFRLDNIDVRSIPLHVFKSVEEFRRSIEETVRKTLEQGIYGWRVTDCLVTMTHSGFQSPETTAQSFRLLAPLVLMSALKEAGTVVCGPMHHFRLEIPADTLGGVLPVLARLLARPQTPVLHGSAYTLEGDIPAERVHDLQQQLSGLTHGEGVLESAFGHYRPIGGAGVPTRARTDLNPLVRKEYLLHVLRRV
jgi:ribosomal protection tetracycline resistance protein